MTGSGSETIREIEVPVLIVGAGPVGLLGARLLGRRGIGTLVAEKYPRRLDAPKAHALNPRSLEICAAAGLPMADLHALATPAEQGADVRMVGRLAGPEFGRLAYERQDAAVRVLTPWPLINIAQPVFEGVLDRAVADLPSVEIRRGLVWQGCDQLADTVVSILLDSATGTVVKVRSRYLIGADGAGSAVRDGIGVPMDGPEALQTNHMIHFRADLRHLVGDRPAILYFLFGPGPNGVLIAYDIGGSWVLMHPMRPGDGTDELDEPACRRIVLDAIGAPVPDLEIKGVRRWVMSAQVARRYRSDRVFLAGDAAHRFPPTGGLGLNTGLADIDNLAWKLAAVETGWAQADLLDSYETERRVIAQTNMGQSLANAMRIRALFGALGYGADQTVDAETFAARLTDPAARAQVDAAIADQQDHFDSLRLQLGYAYGGALDGDVALPISAFVPKPVPGARLPHHWLSDGRSTLDLVGSEGFTLIVGPDSEAWSGFAGAAPVRVVAEARDFRLRDGDWAGATGLAPDGAALIRPDGHILCVAPRRTPESRTALAAALSAYLGNGPADRYQQVA